ncbi:MBL fold metallo-hydrolase [Geomicrobium sediminis]|uniref:Phosphoribosyl 1,2-cyclic phosphodiesterase n=1 Tax=Geomicrobium sediminis TaxID=1347788 RepID=A0ABS2PEL0_9BACL|nr:MBL fold metallo-hydrolase [Geomicrobium sediminis]MBM7633864.1 phosphoribosyl 1,2-cyclic phosphodiesterase [Geomicrobium sediminis]
MINITVLATGSTGNCYHVTDGKTSVLLEAGIRYREIQRKLSFQTRDIAGCLITHEHLDHCKAIGEVTKAGIDCYMSQGTKDAVKDDHHRMHVVESKKQFKLGSWTVLPFDVQHDVSEPLGFLLQNDAGERLLFATDTYYIRYKFKNLTHVMVEANYSTQLLDQNIAEGIVPPFMKKRLMRSHFSIENVNEFFNSNDLSKLQETWLLHLSNNNSDEDQFKRIIQGVTGKPVYVA